MNSLDEFKSILKYKGYKLTHQREKILDIIIKNQYKHLTSEEVYELIKKDYPQIGISTIYRTMQLLEKLNIVCKFDNDGYGVKYELMDVDVKYQHPHFVCTQCGEIFPIKNFDLNLIENDMKNKYNFMIVNYSLKFYGICKECGGL